MKKKCLYFPLVALLLTACESKETVETESNTPPPAVTDNRPLIEEDSLAVVSIFSCLKNPQTKFDPTDRKTWTSVGISFVNVINAYAVTSLFLTVFDTGEGTISPEIGKLFYLQNLTIQGEGIKGKLPEEIKQNLWLNTLVVRNTSIEGNIPEKYFSMPNLKTIEIYGNKNMTGKLPSALSQASNKRIDLSNNNFTGTAPIAEGVHSSVNISNNQLTEIPESYFTAASTGGGVNATGNKITGTISKEILNNPVYMLRLIQCTASQQNGFGYNNFPEGYHKFDPEYLRGNIYPVSERYRMMIKNLTKQDSLSLQEFKKFYSKK